MEFLVIYLKGFGYIMLLMTLVWIVSVFTKNASIVDPFWSVGFMVASVSYYLQTDGFELRKTILLALLIIWGLRLAIYLAWRNIGKPEDYRYQQFRKDYGTQRYWWFSFFQVFLLQGLLLWLISAPLLAAMYYGKETSLGLFDFIGIVLWLFGFLFEAGGDYQLMRFKLKSENRWVRLATVWLMKLRSP